METTKKRVAVIGLDGADWNFLNTMMKFGAMPNTKNMLKNAAKAVIESFPPVTPPAWASISTSVNPGKHGIFGFMHHDASTGNQKLTSTRDLEHPRIYEMLAMKGYESLVFNPIPAYPIIPIENLKVASIALSPKPIYYPKIMSDYARSFPAYTENIEQTGRLTGIDSYLNLKLKRTRERISIVTNSLKHESWDFAWIRFQEPDNLHHFAYNESFSGHPTIIKIFHEIDKLIKKVRNFVDLLVIVSDHGFAKFSTEIYINTILYKHGFIEKSNVKGLSDLTDVAHKGPHRFEKIYLPHHITYILSQRYMSPFKEVLKKMAKIITGKEYSFKFSDVDPLTSKAYLPGKYNFGIITKNDINLEVLKNIILKYDGISNVNVREKFFWGPYISRAPKLMIYPDYEKRYILGSNKITPSIYNFSQKTFDHDPYGIACYMGKDVNPINLGILKPWDIVPSIMAYMKVPLPHDTDGKIFNNVFKNSIDNPNVYNYNLEWKILRARAIK